ncbi:MAG: PAS domain-containing sensor histidine kinase [Thiovulaceae bacterium]|nr:PAS domain-containing sensor histidine kinase [Sulfurimonadaceae bacterium]
MNTLFMQSIMHSTVGFCAISMDGHIIASNEAFSKICDVDSKKHISELVSLDLDHVENYLYQVTKSKVFSQEVTFLDNKDTFYALANASVIVDEKGDDDFIAIFFTEVNKQKDLESKLEERIVIEVEKNRETERMMHQQSKLATMGEMIGNIAHQWRQPLNILALVLQDIYIKFQLGALDKPLMEINYDKANNLLQYMSQTIDDFRTFFKNEEKDELFDVNAALQTVFDLVGTRFTSNKTKCEVELIENGQVLGTENGFKQVVINLLNNAQEAILANGTKDGMIDIVIKKEGDYIVVEVSDNGGGVPQEIIDHVFEPYFTTKHQTQGTGLGLYMSKQIIEHNMGGRLEVKNSKQGAIFSIALPFKK